MPRSSWIASATIACAAVRRRSGRTWGPFGGITAALPLRAIQEHPRRLGEPLALTVNFLTPIADRDFDIALHGVRTNRTNQHWAVELIQDDQPKTNATAVFGLRRDTWSGTEAKPPAVPGPEDVVATSFPDMIVWARQYDTRFVEGSVPGQDAAPASSSTTTLWVRDGQSRPIDFAALTALCDVFYPRAFLRVGHFVPAGTITMTTYFHADQPQLEVQGDGYVLGSARANRFSRGYFDQTAEIWGRDGTTLLATTQQFVYFKE
jgi:acyl-CoA thioesterase